MKKILTSLAAVAILATVAQAQQYTAASLTVTSNIAAASTNSPASAVRAVTRNRHAAIATSFAMTGAGTPNVVFSFSRSADGTNYETTPSLVITNAANGTNTVTSITNLDLGAAGWLKLVSVANTNASTAITNLAVKVSTKPGS
jgi:hypothetical protein